MTIKKNRTANLICNHCRMDIPRDVEKFDLRGKGKAWCMTCKREHSAYKGFKNLDRPSGMIKPIYQYEQVQCSLQR